MLYRKPIFQCCKTVKYKGFETYIQLHHDALEIYVGYTYTVAKNYMIITNLTWAWARNKFATVLAYEFLPGSGPVSRRHLPAANTWTMAPAQLILYCRYDALWHRKSFSFVLNCENLNDYRQTKKENIIIPPTANPTFRQLWAPIDGRVVNLSVRVKF